MKIDHDPFRQTLRITLTDAAIVREEEARPHLWALLDHENRLVGVEIRELGDALASGNDVWGGNVPLKPSP